MRQFFICITLVLFTPLTAMAADIIAPRLSGNVTLDGRLEEPMWREAQRLPHSAFARWVADTYDKDQAVFHLRFFHDGHTLYVALVSYDRYVEADAAAENSDGLYSFSVATRDGKLQHYRLRWSANPPVAGGEMLDSGKWAARLRGPYADTTRTGGGYVFEFAIPLDAIGWKPGDTIPVNIIVHDHNGKPSQPYNTPGAEFARFAWGSLDNDNRASYRSIRLAP
jgi:hypothetical protein